MFERLLAPLARWRGEAANSLRLMAIATVCVLTAGVAFAFLCAAGFIAALDAYGPIYACLILAGAFLVGALVLLTLHAALAARWRRIAEEEAARARAEAQAASPLADPRLILTALQIAQAVGFRRLVPLVAVGAAAFVLARSASGRRSARPARREGEARPSR